MKTYTIQDATTLLKKDGFSLNLGTCEYRGKVYLLQRFTNRCSEYVSVHKAAGRYRGHSIGSAWRK